MVTTLMALDTEQLEFDLTHVHLALVRSSFQRAITQLGAGRCSGDTRYNKE
jgi:hypothetical protein